MNPYLSIVLTGRNDNYGGDFLKRLQDFFDWNSALFESFKIVTEIVFVNWNPIENEPSILELIQFPKYKKYVQIRIITIPVELHESFVNPKVRRTVPIFEFIAKNVGVKRANGEFILCLNADVLLHPKIVEFIADKKLKKEFYYRANR
ncbi:MAG: glycosyltransferase family 2 protein, partial [Crocinitomicaceae bacterium]|nr:glycosyltransferase family 2 protein [Crocinitomicaceae bacterium]NCA20077.1 glycosyltransferase family 2 protein [Crocinitomicaceae bacterium]